MKVSPLRKARRSLNFQPELRREGAGCSVLESTLCLTGMLCILVFFTLYDFNYVPWAQEPQRPAAQRLRARQLVKTTQIPWRGSNISAYPDDAYMQHWEGKRCEMNQDANGVLPAVLVLGVHKGGSTALFQYLSTHGSIRPSYCKEAHFFDWKYSILKQNLKLRSGEEPSDKDADTLRKAYARFFRPQVVGEPPFLSVEGTPAYFHNKDVPRRVRQMLPDTQLVVAMRNPVDRAVSHFMGQKAREFKNFKSCGTWFTEYAQLVKRCDKLRPANLGLGGSVDLPMSVETVKAWSAYTDCVLDGDNPVARGLYAPQLFNWLRSYSPGQLYIMQSEKLFADPTTEMERLTNWLGIRSHYRHEQLAFEVVGSRHMEKFNAQLLMANVGKRAVGQDERLNCDKQSMSVFYAQYEQDVFDLLETYFPREVRRWQRWSEMQSPGVGTPAAARKAMMDAGVLPKLA